MGPADILAINKVGLEDSLMIGLETILLSGKLPSLKSLAGIAHELLMVKADAHVLPPDIKFLKKLLWIHVGDII